MNEFVLFFKEEVWDSSDLNADDNFPEKCYLFPYNTGFSRFTTYYEFSQCRRVARECVCSWNQLELLDSGIAIASVCC